MYKLPMCRICLIKDVRMHCLVSTHLKEIYELLSGNLLETKDTRPLHACYMCCARLRNCLRLRTACLHSEELFSHLLVKDSCEVTPSQHINVQQTDSVINMNIDTEIHGELKMDPSPTTDELHEEHVGDVQDNIIEQGICTLVGNQKDISENVSFEDEELDYSIQSTRSLGNGSLENYISKSYRSISSDLQDIMDNSVAIESPPVIYDDERQNLQDHIMDQGICSQIINQEGLKSENVSSEDEELDYRIQSIKVESDSASDNTLEHGTPESCVSKSNQSISSVEWKDILGDKTVMIVLHRLDLNSFRKAATVTEHLNPTDLEYTSQCYNLNYSENVEMLKPNICKEYKHTSSETHCSENSDSFKHIRTRTRKKSFRCPTCDKCFNQISKLSRHIRTHTGEKPYRCPTCDKCFGQIVQLTSHIRTHTGEKPYKCNTCGKSFRDTSNLSRHIRIHTGEKPYKCDTCGKCFRLRSCLMEHIRTRTGVTPYKCDTCGKCFCLRNSITKHIYTHTGEKPFRCPTCDKCFRRIGHLTLHIRTHTGEKPYKCDTCGKSFGDTSNLSRHIRTHTGEKPYKCDTCGRCFRRKYRLLCHTRTHCSVR